MSKISKVGQSSEHGQAIVLIVLAIFAIFGFAALAIDFGQIFMVRRSSQGAADSAALAAAFDVVGGSMNRDAAIAKAYELAAINGFNNDQVTNWVKVNNPPVEGPYCGICGSPEADEYYQVKITVQMQPVFAQLIYGGAEQTSVEAIAHAQELGGISPEDALVSLSKEDDSMVFDGNHTVTIDGGNIRSFGRLKKNGTSGGIVVTNGFTYYGTTFDGPGYTFTPSTAIPKKNIPTAIGNFQEPYCPSTADLADGSWTAVSSLYKTKNINGVDYYSYASGLSVENLAKGVHCIKGGIGKGNYSGSGVLIVLLTGGLTQTGNDSIDFRAARDLIDANGRQFGGLLLYAPPSNTSVLTFGGNTDAYMQGTFYAPGAACEVGGTANGAAYHTSIICNTVKIHGTSDLKIDYRSEALFHLPSLVELVQ